MWTRGSTGSARDSERLRRGAAIGFDCDCCFVADCLCSPLSVSREDAAGTDVGSLGSCRGARGPFGWAVGDGSWREEDEEDAYEVELETVQVEQTESVGEGVQSDEDSESSSTSLSSEHTDEVLQIEFVLGRVGK